MIEVLSSIEERSAKDIWITCSIVALEQDRSTIKDGLLPVTAAPAILEEENRRNNWEDRKTSSRQVEALVVTRGRSMEPGSSESHNHVASTSKYGNALCCEAAVANESRKRFADVWLFDIGATFHMTARREWFHQYKPISGGGSVYSCNDHEIKIIRFRSIMVKMHDCTVRTIRDVRHVEGLKKNLLSLAQLDDLGCKVEIQNKIMKIIKGALVLMRGEKVAANLYQLKGEIMEEAEALVASYSPSHRVVVTWHQKLGYMSEQGMKILVERNLLPDLTKESVPLPGGRKPIGNKWVYKIKRNGDDQVERYRARLVVKGYAQKEGIDFNEIFSIVVRMTRIRVFLAMCHDVGTRDLILSSGALNITDYMQTLVHISRGPNKDRISKLKAELAREFEMKDLGPANKILGMQIHQDRPISTPFPIDVKLSSKMSPSSKKERVEMSQVPYALAVGSLMFAMICTSPDIAHAVGVVSRYMTKPGREHWEAIKRILIYVKGTSEVALCFGDSDLIVTGYVDSDYAGDLSGSKSTTEYVFTLCGRIVSWVSNLQSVVTMSTTKAEYVVDAQASKEAVWLKMLLEELGHEQKKITLFCNNQSALYLARNLAFHSKTKAINEVSYHYVREKWKKERG
ncbi:retrovirus-related pol polyprotein from transposon TNT 1-94 [Tanacetum coccineum]